MSQVEGLLEGFDVGLGNGNPALIDLERGGNSMEERIDFPPVVDVAGPLKTTRSDLLGRYIQNTFPRRVPGNQANSGPIR